MSAARLGHGWNTTVFICTIHTSAAGWSMTSIGCLRALGKVTGTSRMKSGLPLDRKSTRLNSSHANISYAVFCLKKKKKTTYLTVNSSNISTSDMRTPVTHRESMYLHIRDYLLPCSKACTQHVLSNTFE